ncbi:MAG: DinB family protein [Phaeodactylibacter sp.]|uniref:DinB family protein n=1 Tax=Phaeodactylibacter sp. TaxID=1940289 RepID=UPI0032EE03D7
MKASALIADLTARTENNIQRAQQLREQPEAALNRKPSPESWSALECIEHLNRYGEFYLPEIRERLGSTSHKGSGVFKSGWLGNYFAKSLMPKAKLNKMKTFSAMDPAGSSLDKTALSTFLEQQTETLELLKQARNVDLTKTKTSISISSWIKLRLGDTFRVVIYHNQRHLDQAERAVGDLVKQTGH